MTIEVGRRGKAGRLRTLWTPADHAEAEARAAALRLACSPSRRWGAAAAVGSMRRRPGQAGRDGLAGRGAQPAGRGTGWNSR
jgi:hypothetical protein